MIGWLLMLGCAKQSELPWEEIGSEPSPVAERGGDALEPILGDPIGLGRLGGSPNRFECANPRWVDRLAGQSERRGAYPSSPLRKRNGGAGDP